MFHVGGIAKGAGMIEPMLATMLAFMTTDAEVDAGAAGQALREAATDVQRDHGGRRVFDQRLPVALASGASDATIGEASIPRWSTGLEAVARTLALAIVRGGEGATKLVEIHVTGAASDEDAMRRRRRWPTRRW